MLFRSLDSVPYYLPALHFTLPMPAKFSSRGFFRPFPFLSPRYFSFTGLFRLFTLLSPRCLLFAGLFSSFYATYAPLLFLRRAFFVFLCFFRPATPYSAPKKCVPQTSASQVPASRSLPSARAVPADTDTRPPHSHTGTAQPVTPSPPA